MKNSQLFHRISLAIFFTFLINSGQAQIEYVIYDLGDEFDHSQQSAQAAFPADDGGYLVFGNIGDGFYADTSQLFTMKTDENGIVEWSNIIGSDTKLNYFNSITKTPSNTFLAAGHHKEEVSFGAPLHSLIAKFDENGNTDLLMYHDWEWDDEMQGIIQKDGGSGFVVIGTTQSYGAGSPNNYNVFMMRTDYSGIEQSKTVLDGGYDDFGYSVAAGIDGGYIFAAVYESGTTGRDLWIIRTNEMLDTLWTKRIDASGSDYALSIKQTNDNKYIVAGHVNSSGTNTDAVLLKIDDDGVVEWVNTYGGNGFDYAFDVIVTPDNDYIFCGSSDSYTDGSQVYLVKTNSAGDTIWTKIIPYELRSKAYSINKMGEDQYLLAGHYKQANGDYKVLVIKITDLSTSVVEQIISNQPTFKCVPNPIRTSARIKIALKHDSKINLSLYNHSGKKLKTLLDQRSPGKTFDIDFSIDGISSGMYYFVLTTDDQTLSYKIAIIH